MRGDNFPDSFEPLEAPRVRVNRERGNIALALKNYILPSDLHTHAHRASQRLRSKPSSTYTLLQRMQVENRAPSQTAKSQICTLETTPLLKYSVPRPTYWSSPQRAHPFRSHTFSKGTLIVPHLFNFANPLFPKLPNFPNAPASSPSAANHPHPPSPSNPNGKAPSVEGARCRHPQEGADARGNHSQFANFEKIDCSTKGSINI